MKAILLTLLLALSCTREASVSRDAVGTHISPVKMEISHLNEIEWSVGLKKEEKVSQSFTFVVDMPRVSEDDLKFLTDNYGVDAWILRLISVKGSETQDLGSLYSLFRPAKVSRGSYATGAAKSVSLKVFYAAAYASERFRSFKCPAFDHSRKIDSMTIRGSNEPFSLSIGRSFPYNEKSHLVELTPSAFNGGNSLEGEYFLEIAPYNSKKRYVHSTFTRIPMSIVIKKEELIRVKSCDGIDQENQ